VVRGAGNGLGTAPEEAHAPAARHPSSTTSEGERTGMYVTSIGRAPASRQAGVWLWS